MTTMCYNDGSTFCYNMCFTDELQRDRYNINIFAIIRLLAKEKQPLSSGCRALNSMATSAVSVSVLDAFQAELH